MSENIQIINNIEKEIENAALLCSKEYSDADIFSILKIESTEDNKELDVEKQICILKLSTIKSQDEANVLVHHLTQHHGLIREATAQKINEFLSTKEYSMYFQTKVIADSLLKAVNDINPNICRTIIEVLPCLKNKNYFLSNLYERIEVVFAEIEKLKRSNWYTKKVFNLYWCLEALAVLKAPIDEKLESVLCRSAKFRDYTIREKTAMVISMLNNTSTEIDKIKAVLKNDDNFYVKQYSHQW